MTLDPADWPAFRAQAHRMLDDMLDYTRDIRERPVWQPAPAGGARAFPRRHPRSAIRAGGGSRGISARHPALRRRQRASRVPGLGAWRRDAGGHGGGDAGGGVERQSGRPRPRADRSGAADGRAGWPRIFGFPGSASGLFVTGTSMANLIGVLIARDAELGFEVRCAGVAGTVRNGWWRTLRRRRMAVSRKALDIAGIGSDALRPIATDARHRISIGGAARSDRRGPARGPHAVSGGRHGRNGGHRRHRRSGRAGRYLPRGAAVVPRGRRLRRAGDAGARPGAAAGGHRARRFAGIRFSQVGAGALRRGIHSGARRRAASQAFATVGAIFAKGSCAGWRRRALAVRLRARSFARISRAEDLVHAEGLRHARRWARRLRALARWRATWKRASPRRPSWNCWRRWS